LASREFRAHRNLRPSTQGAATGGAPAGLGEHREMRPRAGRRKKAEGLSARRARRAQETRPAQGHTARGSAGHGTEQGGARRAHQGASAGELEQGTEHGEQRQHHGSSERLGKEKAACAGKTEAERKRERKAAGRHGRCEAQQERALAATELKRELVAQAMTDTGREPRG
jgi:hypothetical protein